MLVLVLVLLLVTVTRCALNWRVSTFVGLYGELRLGWSSAEADAHARRFWEPNEVWLSFIADCRQKVRTSG